MINDHGDPKNYLEAVAILARAEQLPPDVVEELLGPELSDWVKSLRSRPIDVGALLAKLRGRLPEKVKQDGVTAEVAALRLGMTLQSFQEIVGRSLSMLVARSDPSGQRKFLKAELDAFVSAYLPSFKTWSSRTSLLREFHRALAAQAGVAINPQPCEVGGCDELAAVVCANPDCRPPSPPRMVCIAHREHLRSLGDESLCEECVRRVLYGDLDGRFKIAGTVERLQRVHPR